jgi:PhnB protein
MNSILSPYLNFNGNTAEAMKFYQSVLGGELKTQTFGEAGQGDTEEIKNRTIHADLKNDRLSFMASDGQPGVEVQFGNNIHMSLVGTDEAELTSYFNKLAEGGTVTMPLAKQFWGDTFGMLTDKFGVHWMINISSKA